MKLICHRLRAASCINLSTAAPQRGVSGRIAQRLSSWLSCWGLFHSSRMVLQSSRIACGRLTRVRQRIPSSNPLDLFWVAGKRPLWRTIPPFPEMPRTEVDKCGLVQPTLPSRHLSVHLQGLGWFGSRVPGSWYKGKCLLIPYLVACSSLLFHLYSPSYFRPSQQLLKILLL